MLCPLPDEDSKHMLKSSPSKKRKKSKNKLSKLGFKNGHTKKNSKFASAMSTWAESFTVAATWQLKHQLAYWKARAKALEYENMVLHDVIRRNHLTIPSTMKNNRMATDSAFETDPAESCSEYYERQSEIDDNEVENEDVEVSEEFIQFLTANAKYKEDAKRERERLKAKEEEETHLDVQEPLESLEDKVQRMQELYGDKWQKISALEMSMMSDFINESDLYKPMYWPNIPFNFNHS